MAKYIAGINRNQITLFPECIDNFIDENNDVRVIDAFVDSLDLHKLGFKNASLSSAKRGAPSYDPRVLLKIYLYAYPKKIRSSRRIAAEVRRNIELMWLTGRLEPDFRTIADFRKDNSLLLKNVLISFNEICIDFNLFSNELKSLDGSKFFAVNSKDNNFTKDKLVDRLKRIENNISKFLEELKINDDNEPTSDVNDIKNKIKLLEEKKEKYTKHLEYLMDSHENQLSLTDKDSRLMKCNGKMLVGYNAQFVTDAKSHIINDFSISNDPFDNGKIYSSLENYVDDSIVTEVLADGGYKSENDIKTCFENKIVPILPDGVYSTTFEYVESKITPKIKLGLSSKDVRTCLYAGVIPDCYSHLNLELSVQVSTDYVPIDTSISSLSDDKRLEKAKKGYFVRSNSNSVFCPQGFSLSYFNSNGFQDNFVGGSFCKNCPKKCTKEIYKKLSINKDTIIKGNPYYRTQTPKFKTEKVEHKIVVLTYIPNKEKYKIRKSTSEHPFGTLKRTHDASYFLTKGVDKVTGEMALSVLGYNLIRLGNLVNKEKLINYLKSKAKTNITYA